MHCLVTGATGHIGNILVRMLHERGDSVTAFVLPREDISSIAGSGIHIVYGDVRDLHSLVCACKEQDTVFHLAGIIDIGSSFRARKLMYEVNVEGVRNVVSACNATHIERLVYVSSVHALPELPQGTIMHETAVFNPALVRGAYAKTKAEATAIVLQAVKDGLNAVVVHPAGVIGPEDHQLSNTGQMIKDYITGTLRAYVTGGYNFVDARDVAQGIIAAADQGTSGGCYILGGEYHTVKEMLDMMEQITGIRAPRIKIPTWIACLASPFAQLHYTIHHKKPLFTAYSIATLQSNSLFSSEKAQALLGYRIRPFAQTLEDTIAWMMAHLKSNKISKKKPRNQKRKF